jgi:hypothetical protein
MHRIHVGDAVVIGKYGAVNTGTSKQIAEVSVQMSKEFAMQD